MGVCTGEKIERKREAEFLRGKIGEKWKGKREDSRKKERKGEKKKW